MRLWGQSTMAECSEHKYSNDRRLNKLLQGIVDAVTSFSAGSSLDCDGLTDSLLAEVGKYGTYQAERMARLARIGLALSGEENLDRLFEMIIREAREITYADAGTLYLVDDAERHLIFMVLQNDTMNTSMGGTSGVEISLPPVPLYTQEGNPNHANVSSHVALSGNIVNIPDVYEAEGFDFTGPRKYDEATGYRSTSMLVIPMKNHEGDIIGVVQLLNATIPDSGKVVEFASDKVEMVHSLASQAAVALTNARLINDLKDLLYSFVRSIASAIDDKSPYTAGHINRVVDLTMMIAEAVNASEDEDYGSIRLDEHELEELKLAAWMHDVGKITTPEYVVDKANKLETIYDRIELVKTRFSLIELTLVANYFRSRISLLEDGADTAQLASMDEQYEQAKDQLKEDLDFVISCNSPGEFMSDERIEQLESIGEKTFMQDGEKIPYLTEDEILNLSIRKGSLTDDERKAIEHHAEVTGTMLSSLPFPKRLAKVPEYAASHHEKLDGTGYPHGRTAEDLPLQTRILAIADIFEALTAKDRPYKKPMKLSMALKILGFMEKDNHLDANLLNLFRTNRIFQTYADRELDPSQIDEIE